MLAVVGLSLLVLAINIGLIYLVVLVVKAAWN